MYSRWWGKTFCLRDAPFSFELAPPLAHINGDLDSICGMKRGRKEEKLFLSPGGGRSPLPSEEHLAAEIDFR